MREPANGPSAAATPRAVAERFEHLSRAIHSLSFFAGLNPAQWSALRFFARAARTSSTMSAFAAFHRTTKSTASQTIAALVRKRLIRKSPDAIDRRVTRLALTPKGTRLLRRDPVYGLIDALATLPAHELRVIGAAVNRVTRFLFARKRRKAE